MSSLLPILALALGCSTGANPNDTSLNGLDTALGVCNDNNETCDAGTCGGSGSAMLPGSDCLSCHNGASASNFTLGGSVFVDLSGSAPQPDATVTIHDASGKAITLTSNAAGNFYSSAAVEFPITADITRQGQTLSMSSSMSTGACDTCHACGGTTDKLHAP